jgi:hypothetical protein
MLQLRELCNFTVQILNHPHMKLPKNKIVLLLLMIVISLGTDFLINGLSITWVQAIKNVSTVAFIYLVISSIAFYTKPQGNTVKSVSH